MAATSERDYAWVQSTKRQEDPRRAAKVVCYERDERHPAGEVYLTEADLPKLVFRSRRVMDLFARGDLREVRPVTEEDLAAVRLGPSDEEFEIFRASPYTSVGNVSDRRR